MNKFKSILAIALLAIGAGSPVLAITFNFSATGPWNDPFATPVPIAGDVGTLTGTFEATDSALNPGLLDASEISSWSLALAGFANTFLNFSLSSGAGDSVAVSNSGGSTNDISPGFAAGLITFSDPTFLRMVTLDLQVVLTGNFYGAGISFISSDFSTVAFPVTEMMTINGQTFPAPIPLPATLPLLLGGFAAFGFVARRRKC